MHTQTAMDYLDANKAKFERGGDCYTTIPDLEVVVEKHYAWDLPLIVGGVATNNGGKPWGFLASVNDLFKTAQADEDQQGPLHAAAVRRARRRLHVHVDPRAQPLPRARPPARHDRRVRSTRSSTARKKTEYWDGFSWTFDSTAAPTTYAFDQLTYSILDQENDRPRPPRLLPEVDARGARVPRGDEYATRRDHDDEQAAVEGPRRREQALEVDGGRAEAASPASTSSRRPSPRRRRGVAAAAYHDLALGLAPGTTEAAHGTAVSNPSACPSAKLAQ